MPFWSTQDFIDGLSKVVPEEDEREYLLKKKDEHGPERIREASLELSLGDEVFISSAKELKHFEQDEIVRIAPGDFALLITKEWVEIDTEHMAFISMKSGHKLSGLINISGFHVDPGFKGKLKFSIYNAGTADVVLRVGDATFMMFIADVNKGVVEKKGTHWGQKHIEPREMMSLLGAGIPVHDIERRLRTIETVVKVYGGILVGVFLILLKYILAYTGE